MSMVDRWLMNHTTGIYNVDAKSQKQLKERQNMVHAYTGGMSIPEILDKFSIQPQYLDDPKNSEYAVMLFEKSPYTTWIERPGDKTKMFMDVNTKEICAISYNRSDFENDMAEYWNGRN